MHSRATVGRRHTGECYEENSAFRLLGSHKCASEGTKRPHLPFVSPTSVIVTGVLMVAAKQRKSQQQKKMVRLIPSISHKVHRHMTLTNSWNARDHLKASVYVTRVLKCVLMM